MKNDKRLSLNPAHHTQNVLFVWDAYSIFYAAFLSLSRPFRFSFGSSFPTFGGWNTHISFAGRTNEMINRLHEALYVSVWMCLCRCVRHRFVFWHCNAWSRKTGWTRNEHDKVSLGRRCVCWLDKDRFAQDEKEGLIEENEKWQQNDDGNVGFKAMHPHCVCMSLLEIMCFLCFSHSHGSSLFRIILFILSAGDLLIFRSFFLLHSRKKHEK